MPMSLSFSDRSSSAQIQQRHFGRVWMALCLIAARRWLGSTWNLYCLRSVSHYSSSSSSSSFASGQDGGSAAATAADHVLPAVPDLALFSAGAAALDAVHAFTGLPWWATVPLTTIAIKTMLLPVSLKQAKIVRTNMVLWTESFEFERQRQAREKHQAATKQTNGNSQQPAGDINYSAEQQQQQRVPSATLTKHQQQQTQQLQLLQAVGTATAALQQLQQWQQRMQTYHDLRRKCGVPHPAWFVVNQFLQWPIFIYTAASIRYMAQGGWPGFASEGALWFPDLTQPAMVLMQSGAHLPMGPAGLIMPLALTGVMLTSIRMGFRASGAASRHPSIAGTWLSPFLAYLPPVLYTLTLASTYLKLQLPQAAVLHWMASSSYTLGLQLGLRHPAVRRMLGYGQPAAAGSAGDVDPAVAVQAAAVDNPDILVVMGAKHAALQRYNEALHCLQRALQISPQHARAYYSAGQIHAMQHQWQQSEENYRMCAQLSADGQAKGQALYCVGVACHHQQKYAEALDAYEQAFDVQSIQPMVVLGQVRALKALGQHVQATAVAEKFLNSDQAGSCPDVVLDALRGAASSNDH